MRKRRIGVLGNSECSEEVVALAEAVGQGIARRDAIVVCGGMTGVMEGAARGAKEAGGTIIGILPGDRADEANPFIDIPIVTGLGKARNSIVVRTSEVVIAYYDAEQGWIDVELIVGGVAAIDSGIASGHIAHFTTFAVVARVAEVAPARFEASGLTINPVQAQLSQEITVRLNVVNSGGTSGDYDLEMKVNGITRATEQVTLAPQASQVVSFTITGEAVGTNRVEVAGLVGEFEVLAMVEEPPAGINWWLIGGIIALVLALAAGIGWKMWKRPGGQQGQPQTSS